MILDPPEFSEIFQASSAILAFIDADERDSALELMSEDIVFVIGEQRAEGKKAVRHALGAARPVGGNSVHLLTGLFATSRIRTSIETSARVAVTVTTEARTALTTCVYNDVWQLADDGGALLSHRTMAILNSISISGAPA